jgi:hypothetical protein
MTNSGGSPNGPHATAATWPTTVHLLIERDIQEPPAVDQALAPFRRQVEESGMTDDELGDFFEDVREEVWQEKHGRPSKTS